MHWRAPDGRRPAQFPADKSFPLFGVDPVIEVHVYTSICLNLITLILCVCSLVKAVCLLRKMKFVELFTLRSQFLAWAGK